MYVKITVFTSTLSSGEWWYIQIRYRNRTPYLRTPQENGSPWVRTYTPHNPTVLHAQAGREMRKIPIISMQEGWPILQGWMPLKRLLQQGPICCWEMGIGSWPCFFRIIEKIRVLWTQESWFQYYGTEGKSTESDR